MAGLAGAEWRPAPAAEWPWLLGGAGLAAGLAGWAAARNRPGWWSGAIVVAAALAGYGWLPWRTPPPLVWAGPAREIEVVVEVERMFAPLPGRKTVGGVGRIVAADGRVAGLEGQAVYFSVIARISVQPETGGRYEVRGVLERPTGALGGFRAYLEDLGVGLRLMRAQAVREVAGPGAWRRFCQRAQARLERGLRRGLEGHPELAALYVAMLLGTKAEMADAQAEAYRRGGVFHIFSISGLHVGVIALALQSLLGLARVGPRVATVGALAVLWLYVQVTGASTPAERAFLMIAFLMAARVFRLPSNGLAALVAAAGLTLVLDPRQLFQAGFQMSYGVVTALIVMGGPLSRRWVEAWRPWRELPPGDWGPGQRAVAAAGRAVGGALAFTAAAVLASTPSSIGYFGLFSPGALVVNLVVLPLSVVAIVSGFGALLAGLAGWAGLGLVCNHAAALTILVMDRLTQAGARVPGVYFEVGFAAPWMGPAALAGVLATMLAGAAGRWERRAGGFWPPVLVVALMVFLSVKFS